MPAEALEIFPLAPMQRGMLFHCLSDPSSGAYVEHHRFVLEGLDDAAFRRAWELVVGCYPALRTSIVGLDRQEPAQVVWSHVELPWREHDGRELSPREQQDWIAAYVERDTARGFRFDEPPLTRFLLLRCGETRYQLIWTIHHLLVDGWSGSIVRRAVFDCYAALVRGEQPVLSPPRPFSDFIAWLRRRDGSAAEAYWRRRLAGLRGPTRIAGRTGRDAGTVPSRPATTAYAEARRRLPPELTRSLRRRAAQSQVTLNTVVQGAWAILLGRYSGEDDVVFGSVVAGRPPALDGAPSMVGMFLNTVPCRVALPRGARLGPWLQGLLQGRLEEMEHEHSALWEIQKWSDVAAGAPLFEILYVFENFPDDRSFLDPRGPLRVEFQPPLLRSGYPLVLLAVPAAEMGFHIVYDAERYERQAIERLLTHFETLLTGIAAAVDARISELPQVSAAERQQLAYEWNDTAASYQRDCAVHELFERQAARAPEAVAVVLGDRQLSYGELNRRANRLSHQLTRHGVGAETAVGICVDRNPEMVVGFLAILKAGGAYVPLDPEYPPSRLAFMLEDSRIPIVLTTRRLREALSASGARVIWLHADRSTRVCDENPDREVSAEQLAYVIYSSGSTGRPKGVGVAHRAISRLVLRADYLQLGPADRTAQVSNASFDAITFEVWGSLLCGGTLTFFKKETALSPAAFEAELRRQRMTVLFLTTALFNRLASAATTIYRSQRAVLFGGEVADPRWVRSVLQQGAPERLLHVYGPTENTTFSTWFEVGEVGERAITVPIGRPMANNSAYVLDRDQRPVALETTGELYLGGDGLARGYLRRPGITAERFIPHPWSQQAGHRLYRTGDLVRYQRDGKLEFVGRFDHQVKLRGFRIELGEIESVMREHPAVSQAVAVIREDRRADPRLVVYYVTSGAPPSDPAELLFFVRSRLPEPMAPSIFVVLDTLPLLPSGKVDRRSLPAPATERPTRYVAPRTEIEKEMAGIWQDVLGVSRIGVHDDFFDLGGHSMLAMQIVERTRDRFRESLAPDLPLAALFETSTIAALALRLGLGKEPPTPTATTATEAGNVTAAADATGSSKEQTSDLGVPSAGIFDQIRAYTTSWEGRRTSPDSLVVGLNTEGTRPPLFWCFQGYLEFEALARHLGEDQPVFGMRSGHLIMEYSSETIGAVAERYAEEILSNLPEGPFFLGGNCQAGFIAIVIGRLLDGHGRTATLLALLDSVPLITFPVPYPGRVAFLFGRKIYDDPERNPFAESVRSDLLPMGFSVECVAGKHGEYFHEPNVQDLARRLRGHIADALTSAPGSRTCSSTSWPSPSAL